MKKQLFSALLCLLLLCSLPPAAVWAAEEGLRQDWQTDRTITLADPAPWDLDELRQVVDVGDPGSVAAYFVWAVNRLADDYDDGMEMMKYLYADIEVYGRGFTEGGVSGRAGWDSYFNERLESADYRWLPRAYLKGASAQNGFRPPRPPEVELHYNEPNTGTINGQTLSQLGRLNIVYWIKSNAGTNRINLTVSKFEGSDRWYVTSGSASGAMFFDQRAAISAEAFALAKSIEGDGSTAEEHQRRYSAAKPAGTKSAGAEGAAFSDAAEGDYYYDAVQWAYRHEPQVTNGKGNGLFGADDAVTRGQAATFLWRAAGCPEPKAKTNPFADVKETDYWYQAILWANETGIARGTGGDSYSPNQTCSTAHIITFLYRAAGAGTDGWYQEAAAWAREAGVLDGVDLEISPAVECPRKDVVVYLYRRMAE